jgi:hypothetical protein
MLGGEHLVMKNRLPTRFQFERPLWFRFAACRGKTDLFFSPFVEGQREAIKICKGCPVRIACEEYARTLPSTTEGVWAGSRPAAIRRRRKPSRAGRAKPKPVADRWGANRCPDCVRNGLRRCYCNERDEINL